MVSVCPGRLSPGKLVKMWSVWSPGTILYSHLSPQEDLKLSCDLTFLWVSKYYKKQLIRSHEQNNVLLKGIYSVKETDLDATNLSDQASHGG